MHTVYTCMQCLYPKLTLYNIAAHKQGSKYNSVRVSDSNHFEHWTLSLYEFDLQFLVILTSYI